MTLHKTLSRWMFAVALANGMVFGAATVTRAQHDDHGSTSDAHAADSHGGDTHADGDHGASAGHGDDAHGDAAHGGEGPNILTGDLGNVVWTLVIFITLLIVLRMAAWKPILGALQKRERFIIDSLSKAKQDREEAERLLRDYTQQVNKAREEATAIVEEGRRDAEVVRRQIHEEARSEADAMIERAKREIGIARDTAVKDLYDLVADMSTDVAGRIIRRQLSADEHRRLVQESIDELRRMSGSSN